MWSHLVTVDWAIACGVEIRDLIVREPALVHVVGCDVGST